MTVSIKNNTGTSQTWVGQTIAPGAYYSVQPIELIKWQNNSVLLTAIGNSQAVVNTGNNTSSGDITDVNSGINYLKNQSVPYAADTGGDVPAQAVLIGGANVNGLIEACNIDLSNNLIMVGAGIAGTPAGGVLSIQGVAGGTAIPSSQSGAWTTGRTWTLSNSTDSIASVQSGAWTTGRTWDLSSGTDSVAAVQSGSWTVLQGGAPWSVAQSGTWTVQQGNAPWSQNLTEVGGSAITIGQAVMAASLPVVIASNQSAIPVSQNGTWTVQQGTPPWSVSQSGTWTTGRTWDLSSGTDSVSAVQSGAWTTGRTWDLSNTTDSVAAVQSGTWTVQQGGAPWSQNLTQVAGTAVSLGQKVSASSFPVVISSDQSAIPASQSGTWTTGRTWNLSNSTDSVTAFQGGSWTVSLSTETIEIGKVDQGNAGTNAQAWWTQIGDTTHGPVAVKASTTPAATTDAALVVAISPNNTVAVTQSTSPWVTSRNWILSNTTDSVASVQSGTWTTGRTWDLTSGTDSVSAVQSGTWTVQQGSAPWSQNLTEVGGSAIAIGQATMAASLPVVIASNQSAIPVSQNGTWTTGRTWTLSNSTDSIAAVQSGTWTTQTGSAAPDLEATGTLAAANATVALSINAVGSCILETSGTWSGSIIVEASNDGFTTAAQRSLVISGLLTTNPVTANGYYRVAGIAGYRQIRARMSAYTSGSASIVLNTSLANDLLGVVNTNAANFLAQAWTFDGTGNSIGSTSGALNTFLTNTTIAVTQSAGPWTQNITQFGGNAVVTGTGASGLGIPRVTVSNDSNILATQSGTWTVQQGSAPWSQNLTEVGGSAITIGQATMAASLPVVIASNQTAIPASQSGTWTTGRTWTLASGTDSVSAVQSGTWTVQQGTPPWSIVGNVASLASDSGDPVKIGSVYNSAGVAPSTGQRVDLQSDFSGAIAVTTRGKYKAISGAATTVVKSGAGHLQGVVVTNGGGGFSITLYDNTAGSGTEIASINNTAGGELISLDFNVEFTTGLTVVTAGAGNACTICYY